MSRIIAMSLILFVVSACADNILKERPARTTSAKGPAASLSVAKGHASVCGAYRRQLHQVQVVKGMKQLKSRAAELKAKELSLNAVIADVCE
jgi:hypothetical protein